MAPKVHDVSVQQFAALLGYTTQRVYQLIQEGMPHRKRASSTRLVPREAIAWVRERDKALAVAATAPIELHERARKTRAEANIKELEYQKLRGELVTAEEFREFVDKLVGGLAAVAAGRLQRFEREIVRAQTAADARRVTQQIHAALMEGGQEFATRIDDDADMLEAPPDDAPPPAGNRRRRSKKAEADVAEEPAAA